MNSKERSNSAQSKRCFLSKTLAKIKFNGTVFLLLIGVIGMNKVHGKSSEVDSPTPQFTLEKNGRDFDRISIHPNSEDWLFTECSRELNPEGDCYVLRYNLTTKRLQRYALPDGYLYGYASFSPQGHYIVMSRTPKNDGSEEKIRQSLENAEIVMMRSDGTNFSVLPIVKGRKLAPFMSKDETKIAYWRPGVLRPPSSKSMSADFDVCEYDLKSQSDFLFAGPYHFFGGGNAQYTSEDEILLSAYGPGKYAQSMSEYQKKYNGSEVYKLKRKSTNLPIPSFTEVEHARNPSVDKVGNVYLTGQPPSLGSSFSRISPSGEIYYWQEPVNLALSGFRHILAAQNGHYIAFIYVSEGTQYRDQKSAFGRLDTGNSQWTPVAIPALQTSTLLPVRFATE